MGGAENSWMQRTDSRSLKTVETANPGLSQRKWAQDHGLDSTKFNNWTKKTQPDFEGSSSFSGCLEFRGNGFSLAIEGMAVS